MGGIPLELLEMVLYPALLRRDTKPVAKELLKKFGSFAEVVHAAPARLREIDGIGDVSINQLKLIDAAATRIAKGEIRRSVVLSSWNDVVDYCRSGVAFADKEQFRILFLDKRNQLMADEVQQTGTVDQTPVDPPEVIKRALELSATALILVRNHPYCPVSIPGDHVQYHLCTEDFWSCVLGGAPANWGRFTGTGDGNSTRIPTPI